MLLKNFTEIILDAFFNKNKEDNTFTEHHTNSFNYFIGHELQKIIKQFNPITYTYIGKDKKVKGEIYFDNIYIERPSYVESDGTIQYIYPNYCRNTNSTYSLNVRAIYIFKIYVTYGNRNEQLVFNHTSSTPILIGQIPCMIGSKYCNLYGLSKDQLIAINEDQYEIGGYFIVRGTEFIIIPQEYKTPNKIYKNIQTKNNEYSVWGSFKRTNSYSYPYYTNISINNLDQINISVSVSKKNIVQFPLGIFYRAMGVITDKEIHDHIVGNNTKYESDIAEILKISLLIKSPNKVRRKKNITNRSTENKILTQKDALLYIGKKLSETSYHRKYDDEEKIITYTQYKIFEEELFPHIGGIEKLPEKVLFLNHMVRTCIKMRLGIEKPLDTDDYGNKRIFTSGVLYGQLFRHIFNNTINKDLKLNLKSEMENYSRTKKYEEWINRVYNHKKMENMERHISTGEWQAGGARGYKVRIGVSTTFERRSIMNSIMATQKIVMPGKKKNEDKNIPAAVRTLHQTHGSYLDPFDTPDSKSIGVQKHKTIFSMITTYFNSSGIINFILSSMHKLIFKIDNIKPGYIHSYGKILINGRWRFCCEISNIRIIYERLINARRTGEIHKYSTIIFDSGTFEINIYTDAGRFLRPLFVVDNKVIDGVSKNILLMNNLILKKMESGEIGWDYLLENGIIEYVHSHEERHALHIAFKEQDLNKVRGSVYTHCELSPMSILGINVLSIPFANHNQGPRITFQCQMCKQAAGTYVSNYYWRMDTTGIVYPGAQKPLITTIADKYTNYVDMPGGINTITAITTYSGFNIEDSIIVNKQSVNYGLFDVFSYKVKSDMQSTDNEIFMKPKEEETENYKHFSSYSAIDEDGKPVIGRIVKKDDVYIGKLKRNRRSDVERSFHKYKYVDRSKLYEELTPGRIERVTLTHDLKENKIMKVKVRILKKFEAGDKLSSQAAQKSTCSLVMDSVNMPYGISGEIPDIIFNPHGLITRMTIGQMLMMSLGIIAAEKGYRIDGTPFNNVNIEKDIIHILKKIGYKDVGNMTMFNGITGKEMLSKIFVAPLYYQRLKHMVKDNKVSAREIGYYSHKTKQPGKGRQKNGGFKIGDMEVVALIAHGASAILKEKFFDHSDGFECFVSEDTGYICVGNDIDHIYKDKKRNMKIAKVKLPWVFIMVYYLIQTTGIDMKFILK